MKSSESISPDLSSSLLFADVLSPVYKNLGPYLEILLLAPSMSHQSLPKHSQRVPTWLRVNTRIQWIFFDAYEQRHIPSLSTIEWGMSDTQLQVRESITLSGAYVRTRTSVLFILRTSSSRFVPLGGVHSSTLIAVRVPEGRRIMLHKLPEINPTLRLPSCPAFASI